MAKEYTKAQRARRRDRKRRYRVKRMTLEILDNYEKNQMIYKTDEIFIKRKKSLSFYQEWETIRKLCYNIIKKFKKN